LLVVCRFYCGRRPAFKVKLYCTSLPNAFGLRVRQYYTGSLYIFIIDKSANIKVEE